MKNSWLFWLLYIYRAAGGGKAPQTERLTNERRRIRRKEETKKNGAGCGGGAREEVVVGHPGGCLGSFLPTSEGFWRQITGNFKGEQRPALAT